MSNTNELIKTAAFDIITVITVWNLSNSLYSYNNYNRIGYYHSYYLHNLSLNYSPTYPTIIGAGLSFLILTKYL